MSATNVTRYLYVSLTILSVAIGGVVSYYSYTLRPYMIGDEVSKLLYDILLWRPLVAFAWGGIIGIPYFYVFRSEERRWSRLIRNRRDSVLGRKEYVRAATVVFIFPITSAIIAVILNISVLNSIFGCWLFFFLGVFDNTKRRSNQRSQVDPKIRPRGSQNKL
jgi:hypothetical protein